MSTATKRRRSGSHADRFIDRIVKGVADELVARGVIRLAAPAAPALTCSIYALINPDTEVIYYIGKANDPETRLAQHIQSSLSLQARDLSPKARWIRDLWRAGKHPDVRVLEENVPQEASRAAECRWIKWARDNNHPIANVAKP